MRSRLIIAAVLFGVCNVVGAHGIPGTATYLGNEGVLVARGKSKVVFDAFYAESYGNYALVPETISAALLKGQPPYDGIDAVFVSHVHGDHFTASHAVKFLRVHRKVKLFGSKQTYDAIVEEVGTDDALLARIVSVDLSPDDDARTFDLEGLHIEVVAIPHAGGKSRANIQNLSWRVTLDKDTTVLHLGDADTNPADFEKHAVHFASRRVKAAFPPYWFLSSDAGQSIIDTYLNADQVIGIHVPAAAIGNGKQWRERSDGDLFTDPGESRQLD